MAGMGEFHRTIEKAELHVHLEGSLDGATLKELDPGLSDAQIRSARRFRTFDGFIEAYKFALARLREPAHFALALRRLLEKMSSENVRYAEINLSVGVMLARRQNVEEILEALVQEAAAHPSVEVRWLFDAVRQWGPSEAMRVAERAVAMRSAGVVGFGIGGAENLGPAAEFAPVFAWAKDRGLRLAPHAGETGGPEEVWAALRAGAERIGHGIAAASDPQLMEYLRRHAIPLEVCLSSNLATGVVRRLEEHPLRRLFDAAVPITLNTDDPGLFDTTLAREYQIAEEVLGFNPSELRQIAANSFRYAFR
jgi:adenosine deaminase/aminodeoxyfutalosine deaminase